MSRHLSNEIYEQVCDFLLDLGQTMRPSESDTASLIEELIIKLCEDVPAAEWHAVAEDLGCRFATHGRTSG
jgi:hypothetical protein